MPFLRRRSSRAEYYVLSCYATQEAYEDRTPTHEREEVLADLGSAIAAAKRWRADHPEQSTVEVVGVRGGDGAVLAVVDASGVEHL